MNHFLIYNMSNMVCAITMGYFGSAVLERRANKLVHAFVTYFILGFAIPFPTNFMPDWATMLVGVPLFIAYYLVMFKGKLKNKLVAFVIAFVLQNLAAMLPFHLVASFAIENEWVNAIVYEILFLSLALALLYIAAKVWDSISLVLSSPKFMTFFLLPISQLAMTLLVTYFTSHNPGSGFDISLEIATNRIATISFTVILIMSLFADGMFLSGFAKMATSIKEREQLEALKAENKLTYNYIKNMETDIESMNRYRHDMLNLMTTLRLTLESGREDGRQEALALLEQITQKVNGLKGRQYSPCVIVNCVLSYEEELMKRENITCDFGADIPETLGVGELELCRLMMNILDNARESCMKIENESKRLVCFNMRVADGYLYLVSRNSKPEGETNFETDKADKEKHGYGTKIIREIVESGGGELVMDDEGDTMNITAAMKWEK